jgi:two-component system response regulator AtoC
MSQSHILVIDDDPAVRQVLSETLANEGHQVTMVSRGLDGVEAVKDQPVHVVLTDLQMPGIDGLETIDRISKVDSKIIAIVMTGYGTIDYAVRAMKAGAFDFITKPFEPDTVAVVVKKALDIYKLKQENHLLRKAVRDQYRLEHLVGTSAPMRMVRSAPGTGQLRRDSRNAVGVRTLRPRKRGVYRSGTHKAWTV